MIGQRHISSWLSVAVVLLLAFAVSCNRFEYGYDENNPGATKPNESPLSFSVSWGSAGVSSTSRPDQLIVLMGRKVNSLHYIWTLDSNGAFIYPPVEGTDDESQETEEVTPEIQTIANGEYYTVAFSNTDSFYEISEYSEFQSNPAMSMKELYITLPELQAEDVSDDQDLIDFNPYAGFYKSAGAPIYMDVVKSFTFPSSQNVINLTPKSLTRILTVQLKVSCEAGVVVDRISTVLSGVATKVQLMSGLMSPKYTGKLAFDVAPKNVVGEYTIYQGNASVLGIFPPEDRAYVTGPGILQVSVHASVTENGVVRQRVFHAGLNLKRTLEEADMMVESDDKTGYTMKQQSELRVLEILPELKVMKNQIMAGDTEGLDQWFENEAEIMPEV